METPSAGHTEGKPAENRVDRRPPSGTQILCPAPPEVRLAALRRAVLGTSGRVQLTSGQQDALRRRAAATQLRNRVAQAVQLAAGQGLSVEEICRVTGLPPQAVAHLLSEE